MIALEMCFRGEGEKAFEDWIGSPKVLESHHLAIAGLPHGMQSGKPSIAFRFETDDGTIVIGETSLALFLTCADAMKARYGDPREVAIETH